jgi:hypothetical protein
MNRTLLKFLSTWVGEWWVITPWSESPSSARNNDEEEPSDPEDDETLLGLPTNWVRNWKGLMMVPRRRSGKYWKRGCVISRPKRGKRKKTTLYMINYICIYVFFWLVMELLLETATSALKETTLNVSWL